MHAAPIELQWHNLSYNTVFMIDEGSYIIIYFTPLELVLKNLYTLYLVLVVVVLAQKH